MSTLPHMFVSHGLGCGPLGSTFCSDVCQLRILSVQRQRGFFVRHFSTESERRCFGWEARPCPCGDCPCVLKCTRIRANCLARLWSGVWSCCTLLRPSFLHGGTVSDRRQTWSSEEAESTASLGEERTLTDIVACCVRPLRSWLIWRRM